MDKIKLTPEYFENYFDMKNYCCLNPYNIVNNKDTVFITAGIQPILNDILHSKLSTMKKIYVAQPVIRTQFIDSLDEHVSLAFINSTTASFNNSFEEYQNLISDWLNIFYELGLKKDRFVIKEKKYERLWGDIYVKGLKTFYIYNELELGDSTFFNDVILKNSDVPITTFSDIGFGLERIKWCLDPTKSYYDINSSTKCVVPNVKALISAISLLAVNNVNPSNKNSGYRARLFSKKLVSLIGINGFDDFLDNYLDECLNYWCLWQKKSMIIRTFLSKLY